MADYKRSPAPNAPSVMLVAAPIHNVSKLEGAQKTKEKSRKCTKDEI